MITCNNKTLIISTCKKKLQQHINCYNTKANNIIENYKNNNKNNKTIITC